MTQTFPQIKKTKNRKMKQLEILILIEERRLAPAEDACCGLTHAHIFLKCPAEAHAAARGCRRCGGSVSARAEARRGAGEVVGRQFDCSARTPTHPSLTVLHQIPRRRSGGPRPVRHVRCKEASAMGPQAPVVGGEWSVILHGPSSGGDCATTLRGGRTWLTTGGCRMYGNTLILSDWVGWPVSQCGGCAGLECRAPDPNSGG